MFFVNRYESKDNETKVLLVAAAHDANEAIALQQVYLRRFEVNVTYMVESSRYTQDDRYDMLFADGRLILSRDNVGFNDPNTIGSVDLVYFDATKGESTLLGTIRPNKPTIFRTNISPKERDNEQQ
jgi:hypothetical protein